MDKLKALHDKVLADSGKVLKDLFKLAGHLGPSVRTLTEKLVLCAFDGGYYAGRASAVAWCQHRAAEHRATPIATDNDHPESPVRADEAESLAKDILNGKGS